MNEAQIGSNLKHLRKSLNQQRKPFAEMMGLSVSALRKYE